MRHWHEVLPVPIYDVSYEKLVNNQEDATRALLKFLDLEWDDQCLNFFESRRTVRTASFWQVKQPIYQNAMHRWKNYEKFLQPLKQGLGHNEGNQV